MMQMNHRIRIGGYLLKLVSDVTIRKSIDTLSDTATIAIPGSVMNAAIDIESKINDGDQVEIELGYGDDLRLEFSGYVDSIKTDGGHLTIECIDALYLFKIKNVANRQYTNITLKKVLSEVCRQVADWITIECDYDITFEKFTFFNATGYDVLNKIQEDIRANIYFSGMTLHVHAPYRFLGWEQEVRFDFAKNIEKSDLKYVRAKDRKIEVELTIYQKDGTTKKVSYGTPGGQKVSRTASSVGEGSAKKLAKEEHDALVFDGYEGSFTGWLVPFVNPTYTVRLYDSDYPEKNGKYYVVGTEVSYSEAGGKRKIFLGRRV